MPPLPWSLRPGILVAAFPVAICAALMDWSLVELWEGTEKLGRGGWKVQWVARDVAGRFVVGCCFIRGRCCRDKHLMPWQASCNTTILRQFLFYVYSLSNHLHNVP